MTLKEALASARATFPNFPPDVFSLWFDDRIKQSGWPPSGLEWEGFFLGRSVKSWQAYAWQRDTVQLRAQQFSTSALRTLMLIIEAGVYGRENWITAYIPNTVERFISSVNYIKTDGKVPGTLVLLRGADGYEVVEGNHRVAALLYLSVQNQLRSLGDVASADVWVAIEEGI